MSEEIDFSKFSDEDLSKLASGYYEELNRRTLASKIEKTKLKIGKVYSTGVGEESRFAKVVGVDDNGDTKVVYVSLTGGQCYVSSLYIDHWSESTEEVWKKVMKAFQAKIDAAFAEAATC